MSGARFAQALAAARTSFAAGDDLAALEHAAKALDSMPDAVDALILGVNAAVRADRLTTAIPWLERLALRFPDQTQFRRMLSTAHNNIGSRWLRDGKAAQANEAFAKALAVWPDNADALFNCARVALEAQRHGVAAPLLRRVLELRPDDGQVALELAECEIALGALDDAAGHREMLERAATNGRIEHARLARALADLGKFDAAEAQVRGNSDPQQFAAGEGVAFRLLQNGAAPAAHRVFGHLAGLGGRGEVAPSLHAVLGERLALPDVYANGTALDAARAEFATGLAQLREELTTARLRRCESSLEQWQWTNFLLAYQGGDDLALQRSYGELLTRGLQACAPTLSVAPIARSAGSRKRVGLLSSAFRYSTVGSYFGSWVGALTDAGFETVVFQLGPTFDAVTERIGARGSRLHKLTGSLAEMATAVRDANLDLLLFPDPLVDARIMVLAALRLAPRQAMAWGHPVTSGLPSMDAYFGCASMEPDAAQEHYSERLMLLPGIGTSYERPVAPVLRERADLGLPSGHLYLVPQSPYKIHPETDAMLATIAALDPKGTIVLFAAQRPQATQCLRNRFYRALREHGAEPERQLAFLPVVPRSRFLEICAATDVMVDTPHWSGGNTTIDSLISGLPVITTPGKFMRGRQSMAMLTQLELADQLVCADIEQQARRAVAVASDADRRQAIAARIAAGLDDLFDGRAALSALAEHVRILLAD